MAAAEAGEKKLPTVIVMSVFFYIFLFAIATSLSEFVSQAN